jgi:hypothetical protein
MFANKINYKLYKNDEKVAISIVVEGQNAKQG